MYLFYSTNISENYLSREESNHASKVLRLAEGDLISLTDGSGNAYKAKLGVMEKGQFNFELMEKFQSINKRHYIHLAIAPTKNMDRMEWFTEKAVELGVDAITFIESDHSERSRIRLDRLHKKAVSAMKQSKCYIIPKINGLIKFKDFVRICPQSKKFIAHVNDKNELLRSSTEPGKDYALLIGPEGDFSKEEIKLAKDFKFKPVSFGKTTLRTETAGVVACAQLNMLNDY